MSFNGSGAASGAAGGAAAGAALGPWGAAIGGIAGGLYGGFAGSGAGGPVITDPVSGQQLTDASGAVGGSIAEQQAFVNALAAQGGIQNQSNVYSQLQGVANGTGPNPAQAQLAQATSANVANQAALMAGQRGASSNVGLIARQAGQQGAATQQQAAGQAATLQANQSLGALGQLGGIAGQQVAEQGGALQGLSGTTLNNQGQVLGAQGQFNTAQVSDKNGAIAQGNQTYDQNLTGGLLSGLGTAATTFAGPKSAGGGGSTNAPGSAPSLGADTTFPKPQFAEGGPVSAVGRHLKMAKGGKVPVMVSPGERYLSPSEAQAVAAGKKNPMQSGEHIPGKPKVGGAKDSYTNDTVPKTLESGGIVLPRHITQGSNAPEKAAAFVRAILARQGL